MSFLSDGCVPEYSFLCGVRGRADLFGTAVFPPALLLALITLLVSVFVFVWRRWRRPFQKFLQLWVLSGADLLAQDAFPLNLL